MQPIVLMPIVLVTASLLIAGNAQAEGRWETSTSGCQVWIDDPHPEKTVAWSGSCTDGRASGKGVLVWSFMEDGRRVQSRFEGRMKAGDIDDRGGVYVWGNGNRYEGDFFEGLMEDDNGVYTWANGNRYEGEFRKGEESRRGVHIWANGNRYEGEFREGEINGRGTYVWANGDRYEGEFRDGLMTGQGVYIWASGKRHEGAFRDGKAVE